MHSRRAHVLVDFSATRVTLALVMTLIAGHRLQAQSSKASDLREGSAGRGSEKPAAGTVCGARWS
jgi:hypothetical protein